MTVGEKGVFSAVDTYVSHMLINGPVKDVAVCMFLISDYIIPSKYFVIIYHRQNYEKTIANNKNKWKDI